MHFVCYNVVKVHLTLKVTSAMEAGLTDRLWDVSDFVALVDANEETPEKRGPSREPGEKIQSDPVSAAAVIDLRTHQG